MPVEIWRKKPVEIQAIQWTGDNTVEVINWVASLGRHGSVRWQPAVDLDTAAEQRRIRREHIAIDTLEGTMAAVAGDWILRGVHGELYSCKPDIFEKTYERMERP